MEGLGHSEILGAVSCEKEHNPTVMPMHETLETVSRLELGRNFSLGFPRNSNSVGQMTPCVVDAVCKILKGGFARFEEALVRDSKSIKCSFVIRGERDELNRTIRL